jgi:hypothetical protein
MHTMFEPPLVVVILVEGSFSLSKRLSAQCSNRVFYYYNNYYYYYYIYNLFILFLKTFIVGAFVFLVQMVIIHVIYEAKVKILRLHKYVNS